MANEFCDECQRPKYGCLCPCVNCGVAISGHRNDIPLQPGTNCPMDPLALQAELEKDIILSLNLLDDGETIQYRVDVSECNDGSPWVGIIIRDGKESGWDQIVAEISRLQGNDRSDAASWLLDAIARRVGLSEGWAICLVCCDTVKASDAEECPYSERDLCRSCYDSIESQTPYVTQSTIREALELESN